MAEPNVPPILCSIDTFPTVPPLAAEIDRLRAALAAVTAERDECARYAEERTVRAKALEAERDDARSERDAYMASNSIACSERDKAIADARRAAIEEAAQIAHNACFMPAVNAREDNPASRIEDAIRALG